MDSGRAAQPSLGTVDSGLGMECAHPGLNPRRSRFLSHLVAMMTTETTSRSPMNFRGAEEPAQRGVAESPEGAAPNVPANDPFFGEFEAPPESSDFPDFGAPIRFPDVGSESATAVPSATASVPPGAGEPVVLPTIVAAPSSADSSRPSWLGRRASSSSDPAALATAPTKESAPPARQKPKGPNGARPGRPKQPLFPTFASGETDEELPWHRRLVVWFVGFAAMGYGFSLIFHTLLLLALMIVVVAPKLGNNGVGLTASLINDNPPSELISLAEEDSGGSEEITVDMAPLEVLRSIAADQQQVAQPEMPSIDSPEEGTNGKGGEGSGSGKGDGKGDGKGLPFAMPGGTGKVTQKGSFSAWTVPEDPMPGQNYIIVIQIELPENVRRISRKDLLGSMVVGTDGYRQFIPGNTRGFLPSNGKQVQLVVTVPGASRLVRDTITVKSRILKENQTIAIEF